MSHNYIFVLSMPRSGSTLLRVMLNNIEGCVSLPETFFFNFINEQNALDFSKEANRIITIKNWLNYFTVKTIVSDINALEDDLVKLVTEPKDILVVTTERFLKENNISNVNYIIEKSTSHIFFQDNIKKMFPNSKAIYLVRDPRAVAASMLNMPWATHNVYTIARSWSKSIDLFDRMKNNIILKYEDIVNQKDSVHESLSAFFQTAIKKQDLFLNRGTNLVGVVEEYHKNLNKDINTKHINEWKHKLSVNDKEQQIIEKVCERNMQKYGYELTVGKKDGLFYLIYFTDVLKFIFIKLLK
ncbi:MAG: sulfotransferase family protein [Bacteroidia bacterium]